MWCMVLWSSNLIACCLTKLDLFEQDIEALFKQLPLTLDLSQVYSGMSGPQRYRLRCMVCFYGQHYVLLAYKPRVRQWVQYDDTSVKAIGDWSLVEKRCKAGCYQ